MLIYIKLLLMAVFWGGTFISGRMIARTVDPYAAAFLRYTIATFFLVFLTLKMEGRLPALKRDQFIPTLLLGLTGIFGYSIFFFKGIHYVTASKASLIMATNPIFISLLAAVIFKEHLNLMKGIGICLSVAGALIVISNGHLIDVMGYEFEIGEMLICCSVFSWVIYSLLGKAIMSGLSPLVSVCYSSISGTIMLAVPAVFNGLLTDVLHYSFADWSNIFYLGFFGTVLGLSWYYEGINAIGPMKASVFINLVPVSAIILANIILGESVTAYLLIGAVLVVSGVCMTNSSDWIRGTGANFIIFINSKLARMKA